MVCSGPVPQRSCIQSGSQSLTKIPATRWQVSGTLLECLARRGVPVNRLEHYYSTGRLGVQGWLSAGACRMITSVDRVQKRLDVKGNVAEIGVHHGRLFILLVLLCREGETGLAI